MAMVVFLHMHFFLTNNQILEVIFILIMMNSGLINQTIIVIMALIFSQQHCMNWAIHWVYLIHQLAALSCFRTIRNMVVDNLSQIMMIFWECMISTVSKKYSNNLFVIIDDSIYTVFDVFFCNFSSYMGYFTRKGLHFVRYFIIDRY